MPDRQVEVAIANWAPRLLASGVDYNDFVATTARCERWDQWLPEWERTADGWAEIAAAAEAEGNGQTAGDAWLRAAVSRHFGKFVWMLDQDLHERATLRAVEEMRAAHRHLDRSARRLEVPFEAAYVAANLRLPPGIERPPLVVLIPGLDSTKEEFFLLEGEFLKRGMATLSVDGFGQGEVGFGLPIRPDYERGVSAVLDALATTDDVDLDRIGAIGVSLGGFYAPLVAAREKRVKAVVGVSGPYSYAEIWDDLPPMTKLTFTAKAHLKTEQEARKLAGRMSLEGICESIEVPALYATGKLDRLVPWEGTKRMADESPQGEFLLRDDGNHVLANLASRVRPVFADWMRARLDEVG
jgi:pimeloyl-ACP methyl ester carboxylesterase